MNKVNINGTEIEVEDGSSITILKDSVIINGNTMLKPVGFVPMIPPTDYHDMLVGPCSCGTWHSMSDWEKK